MTYIAEVQDVGGCSVGTAVLRTDTVLRALRFVAVTTKQAWAGRWSIWAVDAHGTRHDVAEGLAR